MPKRTNDYQQLILRINQLLADSNAKVTESKLLWDSKSEQNREIDIYIVQPSGPYEVLIGIECTKIKRKVGVPLLERILTKHRNVGINQTVVVSYSGFAETAKKYAKNEKIELLSFGKAMKKSWPTYLRNIEKMTIIYSRCHISNIKFTGEALEPDSNFSPDINTKIFHNDNWILLTDLAYGLFNSRASESDPNVNNLSINGNYKGEWEFSPSLKIMDINQAIASCKSLSAEFEVNSNESIMDMNYDNYGKEEILYGSAKKVGFIKDASVTVVPSGEMTSRGKPMFRISIDINTNET